MDIQPMVEGQNRTNDLLETLIGAMQPPVYTMPVFERRDDPVRAVELEVEAATVTREKPSPELQKALDWLADPENKKDYGLSLRKLEKLIGVSHSWVGQAKKIIEGRE